VENEVIGMLLKMTRISIKKLGEYRTTLISVAVTGKIDVREAAIT